MQPRPISMRSSPTRQDGGMSGLVWRRRTRPRSGHWTKRLVACRMNPDDRWRRLDATIERDREELHKLPSEPALTSVVSSIDRLRPVSDNRRAWRGGPLPARDQSGRRTIAACVAADAADGTGSAASRRGRIPRAGRRLFRAGPRHSRRWPRPQFDVVKGPWPTEGVPPWGQYRRGLRSGPGPTEPRSRPTISGREQVGGYHSRTYR